MSYAKVPTNALEWRYHRNEYRGERAAILAELHLRAGHSVRAKNALARILGKKEAREVKTYTLAEVSDMAPVPTKGSVVGVAALRPTGRRGKAQNTAPGEPCGCSGAKTYDLNCPQCRLNYESDPIWEKLAAEERADKSSGLTKNYR